MVIVASDGCIISVLEPYFFHCHNYDSAITKHLFKNENPDGICIVDRGFGDAVEDQWYNVKMPFYFDIYLGKRNHTKDEAYQSRLITKVRWVV
jgi:hypothetical protein